MKSHRMALMLALAIASLCDAQTSLLRRNVLTNRDITTLANAGFDQEFLIDLIVNSRKQFHTKADALAALAKQGITQPIIEAMMGSETSRHVVVLALVPLPAIATKSRARVRKPVPAILALEGNKPYYESQSVLWGFWAKTVVVTPQQSEESASPHLGSLYDAVLMPPQQRRKRAAV